MRESESFGSLTASFEKARALTGTERERYVMQLSEQDPEIGKQLRQLLLRHDERGVLDEPILHDQLEEITPERIGKYKVSGVLGHGGMGIVYRATQESPKREVALKVLRTGLGTPEMRRRFEFESAALARLNHEHIARVYEIGTGSDPDAPRPYIAMELVDGVTLDAYLRGHRGGIESKLRLMIAVCQGVHHAHQKGIIHRDLKPQNILVDESGHPKIVDFGVARSVHNEGIEDRFTSHGDLVGTLLYMSPEQAGSKRGDIDTRADVYALGVMLYEMLAGCMPYDLSGSSISDATRTISQTPPAPLTRADRSFRGDLNTITLKALRKDPTQRYQSASELASDLQRFLNHEPISARPATLSYVLRRYARRHRALVGFASSLVLVGVVALAIIMHQTGRVRAETSTRREVGGFLKEMLTSLDPEKTAGDELTVRQMLDDASSLLSERFASSPAVRAELEEVVGNTYHKLGEYEKAKVHLESAIADLVSEYGRHDERTLAVVASLGLTLRQLGELERAESLLAEVIEHLAPDTGAGALARINMVTVLTSLGRQEEALRLSSESYARLVELRGADATLTLVAQNNLGTLLLNMNRHDEAIGVIEDNLDRRRAVFGDDHPDTIGSLSNLSAVYGSLGRHDEGRALAIEAAERSERVLGVTHLKTLVRRKNMIVHFFNADLARAVAEGDRLVEDCRSNLRIDHPELIGATEIAVTARAFSGDIEGAQGLAHELYEGIESEVPTTARAAGRAAYLLYNLYDEIGDQEEAERWMAIVERSEYTP